MGQTKTKTMKNLLIASIMLFSFTLNAQVEKGVKNERPVKGESSYNTEAKHKSAKPASTLEKEGRNPASSRAARPGSSLEKEGRNPSASKAARPSSTLEKEEKNPSASRAARPSSTLEKEEK